MIYIGIDPGLEGAIATWEPDAFEHCGYTAVDMPCFGKALYVRGIVEALSKHKATDRSMLCCIEKSQAMPGQGVTSCHTIGKNYGILLGVLGTLEIPVLEVSPSTWKRQLGLSSDKQESIRKATELFPQWTPTRKKDHNKAEALLVAWWGSLFTRSKQ